MHRDVIFHLHEFSITLMTGSLHLIKFGNYKIYTIKTMSLSSRTGITRVFALLFLESAFSI